MNERREKVYFKNLAEYYHELFYMLLDGHTNHDDELLEKAQTLMKATENTN